MDQSCQKIDKNTKDVNGQTQQQSAANQEIAAAATALADLASDMEKALRSQH